MKLFNRKPKENKASHWRDKYNSLKDYSDKLEKLFSASKAEEAAYQLKIDELNILLENKERSLQAVVNEADDLRQTNKKIDQKNLRLKHKLKDQTKLMLTRYVGMLDHRFLMVIRKGDNRPFRVIRLTDNNADIRVRCDGWGGEHVIGQDCEFPTKSE